MGTIAFGPGLAGFPAFPLLPFSALSDPSSIPPQELQQIEQTLSALDFQFTDSSFSFTLDSAIFGRPGAFSYDFTFGGDFTSMATLPPGDLLAAFAQSTAGNYAIRFQSATTVNNQTGALAIHSAADSEGPAISFAQFFSTLLDPSNYTQDLLASFTQNLAQFSTLDLSAFANGVIDAQPNGPTISTDGTITQPDGSFAAAQYGVVSFAGEVSRLTFTNIVGGPGREILGAGDANATVTAGSGDDILIGGAGTDQLSGGAGADILIAGQGGGTLTGGTGADMFIVRTAPGSTTTIAGLDVKSGDRVKLPVPLGSTGVATGTDSHGDVTVTIGQGAAAQTVVFSGITRLAAVEKALANGGTDFANLRLAPAGGGAALHPGPNGGVLIGQDGPDVLQGASGSDVFIAGTGNDVLISNGGNDVMIGGAGDDTFFAGRGDDVMDGGSGDNLFFIGSGHDVITGGAGLNTFKFVYPNGAESRITDFRPGQDLIDLSQVFGKDINITPNNWERFVKLVPLGPTELTGFLEISPHANGQFQALAQMDGAAFKIVSGQSTPQLGYADFILPSH